MLTCSYYFCTDLFTIAHGGDRGVVWQAAFAGARLGLANDESRSRLLDDLRLIQPTFFLAMSHFWAELYHDFLKDLELQVRLSLS